jgi:hypothetical protein
MAIAIELSPAYVDVGVKRWQDFTGEAAVLDGDGRTFDQIAAAVHKHEGQIDNGSSALESVMRDVARLAPDQPVAGDTRGEDPGGNSGAET